MNIGAGVFKGCGLPYLSVVPELFLEVFFNDAAHAQPAFAAVVPEALQEVLINSDIQPLAIRELGNALCALKFFKRAEYLRVLLDSFDGDVFKRWHF